MGAAFGSIYYSVVGWKASIALHWDTVERCLTFLFALTPSGV